MYIKVMSCTGISIAVAIVLCAIAAAVINAGKIRQEHTTLLAVAAVGISSFLSGAIAAKKSESGVAVVAGLSAALFLLCQLIMGIFIFDSGLSGVVPTVCAVIIGNACGCLAFVRNGKRRKKGIR